ncbi:hemerythrin domain-containing protein [Vampirovibrio sp.]|uniref:hemerythrin domain-containing protein n=1 Tax=Vampirovibrio sp. TaxID=2717857 RepID=UPI0035944619
MMNCCDRLIAEHRETEVLLAALEAKINQACDGAGLDASGWRLLEANYLLLAQDLRRHFLVEELALFALLSPYRTMMLMEVEHDDLLTLQQAFATELRQSVEAQALTAQLSLSFSAFKTRLLAHIIEEERGIFPLANASLEAEEQQKALRVYETLHCTDYAALPSLPRRVPGYEVRQTELFEPILKPLSYETCYEREHAAVQHLRIQSGMQQASHWVGQHQCMVLISGAVTLTVENEAIPMTPGQMVSIDSRRYYALRADSDAHLLVFKVWPHPHYVKAP